MSPFSHPVAGRTAGNAVLVGLCGRLVLGWCFSRDRGSTCLKNSFCGEPEVDGGSLTTVTGPDGFLRLRMCASKPEALEFDKTTS